LGLSNNNQHKETLPTTRFGCLSFALLQRGCRMRKLINKQLVRKHIKRIFHRSDYKEKQAAAERVIRK